MYGRGFPDCVLVARKELMAKEPEVVKNVIRVLLEAEYEIENDFEQAAKMTIGKYYKTDMTTLMAAAQGTTARRRYPRSTGLHVQPCQEHAGTQLYQ